jgi:hypothetical protein
MPGVRASPGVAQCQPRSKRGQPHRARPATREKTRAEAAAIAERGLSVTVEFN